MSEEEEKQLGQMSAEKAKLYAGARNFMQQLSAADTEGADKIREAEHRYDEHKIDIRKDPKE